MLNVQLKVNAKRYGGIIKTGFNRFFATSIIKRYVATYECAYLLISRVINSKTNTKLKQRNQVLQFSPAKWFQLVPRVEFYLGLVSSYQIHLFQENLCYFKISKSFQLPKSFDNILSKDKKIKR